MSDAEIFSGRRLTRLPKTQFSGLDFDNIMADVSQLVLENPEYNQSWDDFLSSDAGRMMVELFAYISDQLATRVDWMVNENFIGTATQKKSIVRLLKLIGYNLSLPTAAVVPITMSFDRPVGTYKDFSYYDNTGGKGELNLFSITATGRDGTERKNFEAIEYDEINKRYLYRESIEIITGTSSYPELLHTVDFHEGRSFADTITIDTNNNFVYTIQQSPIIENSVDVFLLSGENSTEEIRLEQVKSFLDPRAQREEDIAGNEIPIPYIVNVLDNDRVSIEFGPTSLLPYDTRRPRVGDRIRIFYRTGGGLSGNITRKSVNTKRKENVNGFNVNITYVNNASGTGGAPGESLEYAANYGPLQIRTAQKAVTEEDYNILLMSDNTVMKAKAFGNNNIPSNLFGLYGLYIRPLEVWNYVVVNKPGWQNVPPSKYPDFNWVSLRLENRFNEVHSFVDGLFNRNISSTSASAIQAENSFECQSGHILEAKNFLILPTDYSKDLTSLYILNEQFRTRITSKQVGDNFFDLTNENNLFSPVYELNSSATLRGLNEQFSIKQDINAYFISLRQYNRENLSDRTVELSFDSREPVTVTFPTIPIDQTTPRSTVVDMINRAFKDSSYYNDDLFPKQASVTITSASGSGAEIVVSATEGGAYDESGGNALTIEFVNVNTYTDPEVSMSGDAITVDFGGPNLRTAQELIDAINALGGIEASISTAGNFDTTTDGGVNNFTGGADATPRIKGQQRLGFSFFNKTSRPKKNIDADEDISNNYIILQNSDDGSYHYFWININGLGTDPAPTVTGETLTGHPVAITIASNGDPESYIEYISTQLATAINSIVGFTATSTDTKITVTNDAIELTYVEAFGDFIIFNMVQQGSTIDVQIVEFEIGINFIKSNLTSNFRVNGIQYDFITGTDPAGPTYEELTELMQNSVRFKIKAAFVNQGKNVVINSGNEFIHYIKKGMRIEPVKDETSVLTYRDSSSTSNDKKIYRINNVNWKNDTFDIDNVANATIQDYEIWLYPYDVEIDENPDNISKNDIFIKNPTYEPVSSLWIQQAQNVDYVNNFFEVMKDNFYITSYDFDTYGTVNYGVSGSQYLNINAVVNATNGFHSFTGNTFNNTLTDYQFTLQLDEDIDVLVTSQPGNSFVVNATTAASGTDIIGLTAAINTALDNEDYGPTSLTPVLEARVIDGKIRIVSTATTGISSKVLIQAPVSGNDLVAALGLDDPVDGLNEPTLGLMNGTYQFELNNYVYSLDLLSTNTYNELFTKINDAIIIHGYTTLKEMTDTQGWKYDLKITNNNAERVRFEDVDLFSSLVLTKIDGLIISETETWNDFGTPIGGGDYSAVAKDFRVATADSVLDYFALFSPSISQSSRVDLYYSGIEDAAYEIFGIEVSNVAPSGTSETAYGYNRATLISNPALTENYGKIVYELGTLNFRGRTTKDIFYHFVYDERKKVIVGRYNYDNFAETDPSYRGLARRIYNTRYNTTSGNVDTNLSKFDVKFTKEETDEVSLYAISDDWKLEESEAAFVRTITFDFKPDQPGVIEDGYLNSNNYLIKINIDNIGDVTIDLTGDNGTSSSYTLEGIVDNINQTIQEEGDYASNFPLYRFFIYARINDTKDSITISSPVNSEQSRIIIKEPDNSTVDATSNIFGIDTSTPGYVYEIFPSGDYYIDLNKIEFKGNFLSGERTIEVTEGIAQLTELYTRSQEGALKLLEVTGIAADTFISKVDVVNNIIELATPAASNASNKQFFVTDDMMALFKIPKEEGNTTFPDLNFRFHFIDDRRYVEGVYDGRVEETGEGDDVELVRTNGFPLLSLDEDIYDTFLADKKVVGVNHLFKQPKFSTFDIEGTVYYKTTFSRVDVESRVEESLYEFFGLVNRDFGQIVARSKIMNIIHQNEGVDYVEIDYFGRDLSKPETNVSNAVEARFDEIIVLSEAIRVQGVQVSGIKFEYKASGV